jgi:hypothetical protein
MIFRKNGSVKKYLWRQFLIKFDFFWSEKWFYDDENLKKRIGKCILKNKMKKEHFSQPKCSNHRRKCKKHDFRDSGGGVPFLALFEVHFACVLPFFSINLSDFITGSEKFCYVLLSHGLHEILQKFFFINDRFSDTCFPFRRLKWGQKRGQKRDRKVV